MQRTKVFLRALAFATIFAANLAFAQLPNTELTSVTPPGGKQGSTIEVRTAGANQEDVTKLLFSHPGIVGKVKMQTAEFHKTARPINATFEVKIDPAVPPGVYDVRVVGRFGASNPRAFVVGRFEEVTDSGSNRAITTPQEVKIGTTINGAIDGGAVDYYKVALKKDQRIMVDCLAQRIDSRADATLIVMNAKGRELAKNRDSEGQDPLIDFKAPEDGEYMIGVYDFLYRGGSEYFYRLTVHADPHVDFVFPPCGDAGSNAQYTIYGRNLPGGKPANVSVNGAPLEMLTASIQLPADKNTIGFGDYVPTRVAMLDCAEYRHGNSGPVRVGFAKAPVQKEQEPNNDPKKAQKITIPCDFAGQFYPARDADWVEFEAKKGQAYWIEVISHRMGIETDPYLIVQKVVKNDKGEEQVSDISNVDDPGDRAGRIGSDFDTSTDDPSFKWTVPADATYRIMVRDQFGDGRSDARNMYRLIIRPDQPDFRLVATPERQRPGKKNANQVFVDTNVLRKGDTIMVKVTIDRHDGFNEAVELTAEGLPTGVTCHGATANAGAKTAMLTFTAEENAPGWSGGVKIVGKSKIGDKEVTRIARSGAVVWGTGNRTTQPPAFRAARQVVLSVTDNDLHPAFVKVGDGNVLETSLGGKLDVPVKVTRRVGNKVDLKLVATGMPGEIKPADITVKGATPDGKLAVAITNAKAKAGYYVFYLRGEFKMKLARNPDAIKAAEAEQKEVVEALNSLNEQVKQATTAKTAADKAVQTAMAELKKAQAAKSDTKAVEAAQKKLTDSQNAQKAAVQKLTDTQARQKRATAAKTAADKKVADQKKNNAPKDVNICVVSTPIKLRIAQTPITLSTSTPKVTVKQEGKTEIALALAKKYGFDDNLEVTLEPPKGVAGLTGKKVTIAKGKADGKLELTVAKNAKEGEHTATLRAKGKFNNINIESTTPVVIKVEKK